ncbi:ABC transporter substrate-binding protein [Nocardioides alcanivorans]|uniref:ABC transporter substrate-binding protein n=1 Tax=Nocardioides alcanivorans TaxID=2897352 RepID=UPI0024B08AC9|nr:ABC transporter substrate-binding protein [Nocardioides alcanivorans]
MVVKVTTKRPYPNLLQDSPVPIATGYYNEVGEDQFMRAPVAAGPFKFVSQEVNQSIVVARFDDFWDEGRKANFERLVMKAVPDETTRISGLQSGQLDVVQGLSANGAEQLDGSGGIRIVTSESASLGFIQMLDNRDDGPSPLKNLRVREALLMAVDRQAIADTLYKGYAQVAATPMLTTTDGYDASFEPQAYDPDRAKQILAEEGAANLELDLNSYSSSPSIPNVMKFVEAISGYWAKVGVKVNLTLDDNATYVQKSYDQAYDGASVFSINGSFASELTGYVPYFTTDGILTSHADTRFDDVLDKALATMDDGEREEYGRQLNELMRETLYVLPMVRFDNVMAIGPRVAEFRPKVATPIAEPFWYLEAE